MRTYYITAEWHGRAHGRVRREVHLLDAQAALHELRVRDARAVEHVLLLVREVSAIASPPLFSQPITATIDVAVSSPPAPPVSGSPMSEWLKIRKYVSRKRGACFVVTLASTSDHVDVLMMNLVDSEHRRSASSGL